MVEYTYDTGVHPRTPLYRLKILGEGAPGKRKKRKINVGKSKIKESKSYTPLTAGPLENSVVNNRVIKELVSGLPQGPKDSSTRRHSYVSRADYEKYQDEQQTQGETIAKLERAY